MSFWKELSRRNVVKVGIAYAVAAWLIIHPVDIIFPILHLPEWSITLVTAILIILFPLVLIFSWVYEVTPKGLKKTKEVPVSKSTTQLTGRKLNYIIIGLLVVAVAFLLFDKYFIGRGAGTTQTPVVTTPVPAVTTAAPAAKVKKSIAVLPFKNMSSDKEQESFVDGLSEELINTINQIPDLRVIARTSCFTFKDSDKTAQEIAKALNVEYILEGSVRKAGKELRITAQLINAADESHLWSDTYDKELKDIFAVQEDIATAVATELKATLGVGKSLKQLGGTDNVEAYEQYLVAQGLWNRNMGGGDLYTTVKRALDSIDATITLDPGFALAWARKSYIQFYLSIFGPANRASSEQDTALQTAQNAIELEPALAEGYYSLGHIKAVRGKFIEAESDFRKALELTTKPLSGSESQLGVQYCNVGYFKRSQEVLEEILRNDPLNMEVRGFYLGNFWFLGDKEQAEKEYKQGRPLFGDQWMWGDVTMIFFYLDAGDIISSDAIVYSDQVFDIAKEHLKAPQDGLKELRRIYSDKTNISIFNMVAISLWAAYFGDPEFAMDAMEKALRLDRSSAHFLWFPSWREVRRTPQFKKFVREIGLVDYWNQFGWPDMCHQLDNGDFVCD